MVLRLERLLRPRLASAEDDTRPLDALGAAQAEAMNSLGTAPPDTGWARKVAAYLDGFSLHAAVHLHANDREGLAYLCGYGPRPPFSQERLSELQERRLAYRLKRPLGNGRQMLLLQTAPPPQRWFRRRALTSSATTASSRPHRAGARQVIPRLSERSASARLSAVI